MNFEEAIEDARRINRERDPILRRERIVLAAAIVTPGLLQANGMQELPVQARLSVELAILIEKEAEKQIPLLGDPEPASGLDGTADADTAK